MPVKNKNISSQLFKNKFIFINSIYQILVQGKITIFPNDWLLLNIPALYYLILFLLFILLSIIIIIYNIIIIIIKRRWWSIAQNLRLIKRIISSKYLLCSTSKSKNLINVSCSYIYMFIKYILVSFLLIYLLPSSILLSFYMFIRYILVYFLRIYYPPSKILLSYLYVLKMFFIIIKTEYFYKRSYINAFFIFGFIILIFIVCISIIYNHYLSFL